MLAGFLAETGFSLFLAESIPSRSGAGRKLVLSYRIRRQRVTGLARTIPYWMQWYRWDLLLAIIQDYR
jgi:hypothetical protein